MFTIIRDGAKVGNGLLDCGLASPPWFKGQASSFPMPYRGHAGRPEVLHTSDNPYWSVPLSLRVDSADAVLKSIVIADRFRLYAVACDGLHYQAAACIEWGTDITFTRTDRSSLAGTISGRKVWADAAWSSSIATPPIVEGQRANEVLLDQLVFFP